MQLVFGALVRNLAYDPYGGRRSSDWLGELDSASTETLADDLRESTTRGYTGHEQLDRTGFVHMNGRVYDPVLGRFLSPDPIVQNPAYSQSWNRYSYVMNSPMSFTDPSGYVRQGSICSGGLIMCMNGDGSGVGGSNASFSVPRTTQTIRTSGSTYRSWQPTGREFVVTGWTYVFSGIDQRLIPQGEYRDTGFYQTRYSGGASTSIETSSVKVNSKESSETDEPISDQFTATGDVEDISAEDARELFGEVLAAAESLGEDVSDVKLDEGFGVRFPNGKTESFESLDRAKRAIVARGGNFVAGTYDRDSESITLYRNAFSTRVNYISLGTERYPEATQVNYPRGFEAGLYILGHELGHKFYSPSEQRANYYGKELVRKYCEDSPTC